MSRSAVTSIAVHCRNLVKTYGTGDARVQALRGVDLDVHCGELLMLVGPSGCGKTTLISIIAAILREDAGICEVFGQDLSKLTENGRAAYRRSDLGFVFQVFNLFPSLTALENVTVPLLMNGASQEEANAKARDVLHAVGLEQRSGSVPSKLSGGQQQRIAIARAIAHQPRLVLCDEPTSNLDHEAGQNVMAVLTSAAKRPDRALIVVSHDERIFKFADRIARMDDGRVVEVIENRQSEVAQ